MLGGYACVFCSFDWILGSMLGLQYFDVVRLTMVCVILRCCNLLQVNDGQRGGRPGSQYPHGEILSKILMKFTFDGTPMKFS